METLALLAGDPDELAAAVEAAALRGGPAEDTEEMFVRVTGDAVETPASSRNAELGSYCTLTAARFDRLELSGAAHADAMFEIDPFLGWLDWVEAERVQVRLVGTAGVAAELVVDGGDSEVRMACLDDPALLESVDTVLPGRFDGEQFLDAGGDPMPTTVETTVAELERLVEAVDLAESTDGYPVVVREGSLAADVEGRSAHARATLDATVEGAAVTNHYGQAFAAVVASLEGDVRLQTGPGEPVALVQSGEDFTLRFVVAPL